MLNDRLSKSPIQTSNYVNLSKKKYLNNYKIYKYICLFELCMIILFIMRLTNIKNINIFN